MDNPQYESNSIKIFEWPQPICEIIDKDNDGYVSVKTPEDARAIMKSMTAFLMCILEEFGGDKK